MGTRPDTVTNPQGLADRLVTRETQSKETMNPELTCGVETHDPSCLCDVIITEPTTVNVVIPFSYQFGPAIVEHFNLGVPWTSYDLAVFLQSLDKINEIKNQPHLWNPDAEEQSQGKRIRKLTPNQLQYFHDLIRANKMPKAIIQEIQERFDVTLSKSYVTHTKTRLRRRGEF